MLPSWLVLACYANSAKLVAHTFESFLSGLRLPFVEITWVATSDPSHISDKYLSSPSIVVWNVKSGEAKCTLSDAGGRSSTVAHMEWLDTRSDPRGKKKGLLYMCLRSITS